MAEPGGDRPRPRDIPAKKDARPTIADLRERVAGGEGVHRVILSALRHDSVSLGRYFQAVILPGSQARIDPAITDFYGLRVSADSPIGEIDPQRDLDVIGGFSYVVNHFYPKIVEASEPPSERRPVTENPLANTLLGHMNPLDAANVLEQLDTQAAFAGIEIGELRRELEGDPSGISWLQEQVAAEFGDSYLEEYGALRAVAGAEELYRELTTQEQK